MIVTGDVITAAAKIQDGLELIAAALFFGLLFNAFRR